MLQIRKSCSMDDQSGRVLLTFTPVLTPATALGRGEITFAIHQVWADEPETYQPAMDKALNSAREAIRLSLL